MELTDRSLLIAMLGPDGRVRYRMLDTLRAFGRERLARSGEYERARQAHARYYARALGAAATPDLSWWSPAIMVEMRGQMEDRLAAVDWCSANQPVLVTMITRRLVGFWGREGPLVEGRQWLDRVLVGLPAGSSHRAIALANAAWLAQRQGSFDVADAYALESLGIRRELGHLPDIADGLARLGDVARHRGDLPAALGLLEEAVSIDRSCATEYDLAIDLMYLGNVEGRVGRLDAAREHLEEALRRFTSTDEPSGVAYCQGWLAELALAEGDRELARRLLGAAMSSFRGLQDRWEVAILLDLFGWLAVMEGDPRRTLRLAGAAAAIRESMGGRPAPSLATALAPSLAMARRALGSGAARAMREGARARPENVVCYALREADLEHEAPPTEEARDPAGLTPREREVVAMIAEGLTNREIGSRLGISVRTAEYHVEQVRAKLGHRSRVQVAAWAAQGALPPPS
jgi:non-specific serine/threonine protein kinase